LHYKNLGQSIDYIGSSSMILLVERIVDICNMVINLKYLFPQFIYLNVKNI